MLPQNLIRLLLAEANKKQTGDYTRDLYCVKMDVELFIGEQMKLHEEAKRQHGQSSYRC